MTENIKVNALEIAIRLKDNDRVLALTDEVNNEVKTISIQNLASSLISSVENNLITNNGGLYVDGNVISELVEALKTIQAQQADEIGRPIFTLSNTLLSNEIWLEGQEVLREQYARLFEIYGETYGAGDGTTTFNLPDCRNRVMWGSTSFGYIEAGLPNITGNINYFCAGIGSGAFHGLSGGNHYGATVGGGGVESFNFDASRSSAIYGNSNTVQPPAIKCRVKTRFE